MLPINVRALGSGHCSFPQFNKQKLQGEVFFLKADCKCAEEKNRREFVLLLPGQRQGGLAASRAARSRTGGKRPWLSEFSKPWVSAPGKLGALSVESQDKGCWDQSWSPLLPIHTEGRTRVLLTHPSVLCSQQLQSARD